VESAPRSLPYPSDNGDDGWTEDSTAELEKEVGLALVEQVESISNHAPTSPLSPRSVKVSHGESQTRECTETTTTSLPEECGGGGTGADSTTGGSAGSGGRRDGDVVTGGARATRYE
jgi:hypothetical protein